MKLMFYLSSGWYFVDAKYRPQIFFPSLKFLNIKSIASNKDLDARNSGYYWFVNETNGIRGEYKNLYKITSYCDFNFISFPFETLKCDMIFRSSQSSSKWTSLLKPELYSGYINKDKDIVAVNTSLPYEIWAGKIEPFLILIGASNYSTTGISFQMKRNDLGMLVSQFYGPTAIFTILSMLSYNIDVGMVSLLIDVYLHQTITK